MTPFEQAQKIASGEIDPNAASVHEDPSMVNDARIEVACEIMHDAYEKAAIGAGWETQESSRKPWADVPEANKATMRASVRALLSHLGGSTAPAKPCLCKYTVAELVESLKGRTLCGSVTTNAGDTTNWGFAQEGKAD
jgi:hypothetical protein